MKLEEMLDAAENTARHALGERGNVSPMVIGHGVNDMLVPVLLETGSEEEKEAICEAIKHIFRQLHVDRYAVVVEMWFLNLGKNDAFIMPSKSERRREGVLLLAVDDTEKKSRMFEIERNADGSYKELHSIEAEFPPDAVIGGRFAELLETA